MLEFIASMKPLIVILMVGIAIYETIAASSKK